MLLRKVFIKDIIKWNGIKNFILIIGGNMKNIFLKVFSILPNFQFYKRVRLKNNTNFNFRSACMISSENLKNGFHKVEWYINFDIGENSYIFESDVNKVMFYER
jgi:hypothetical protein